MTVSSTTRRTGPYTGNGVTTLFPFDFKVFDKSDVLVTFTNSFGNDASLVLDSDYTVTLNLDQNTAPGGTILYPAVTSSRTVLSSVEKLTFTGDLEETQPTDIPNLSAFFPDVVEDALDRCVILIQQLQEQINRALKFPISDPSGGVTFPSSGSRANKLLGFDAAGNPTYVVPTSGSAADVLFSLSNATDPSLGVSLVGGAGRVVDSVAVMRQMLGTKNPIITTRGYLGANGRGAGTYRADLADTTSSDNGVTIIRGDDGTRWKLQHNGTVTLGQGGATGLGVANDTAAVQRVFDTGLNVAFEPGTYLIGAIGISPRNGWRGVGAGVRTTTFQLASSNTRAFYYNGPTNSSIESCIFGNFAVKAHALGSNVTAIDLCGFRDSTILPIEGLSTANKGCASILDFSSYPALCYNNIAYNPRLYGQTGWANGVRYTNGGSGDGLNNANINSVVAPWIVDNVGMSYAIDATRSTKAIISNGLIEGNTGATYIRMGQATTVRDNWLEHRVGDTAPYFEFGQSVNEYVANDCLVEGNYIGPTQVVVNMNSVCKGNLFLKNKTEAGPIQFVNSPGRSNVVLDIYEMYNPSNPTFTKVGGAAGSLGAVTVTQVKNLDQFAKEAVFQINAPYTPTATGVVTFQVQVSPTVTPAGLGTMQLIQLSGSVHDASSGSPMLTGFDNSGAVRSNILSATPMSVQIQARYVLTGAGNQ